jgi:hypothetical protein
MNTPSLFGSDQIDPKTDAAPAATRAGVKNKNFHPHYTSSHCVPPSHHSAPVGTSKIAAQKIAGVSESIGARILHVLYCEGEHGLTDDEGEALLGIKPQSYTPSRRKLVLSGLVVDSRHRRDTSSGRPAAVWVLAPSHQGPDGGAV